MTSRLCVRTTTIVLAASIAFAHPAAAAETFIRDTEIEADIQTMVTPIWKVAGLEPSALHVYLVASSNTGGSATPSASFRTSPASV